VWLRWTEAAFHGEVQRIELDNSRGRSRSLGGQPVDDAELSHLLGFSRREVLHQRLTASEAEDVLQDALVSLLLRFESIQNPLAYLKVVIRRLAALVRRSRFETSSLETTDSRELDRHSLPVPDMNLRIDLNRALTLLSTSECELLSYLCEGRSFEEIGSALGCSPGAARVRAFRVRSRLRSCP
jgi:RNA polymerase sigma factor (sigma-70 family)